MNKVNETKAVLASRTLLGSDKTKVAKEQRATKNGADVQRKVLKRKIMIQVDESEVYIRIKLILFRKVFITYVNA